MFITPRAPRTRPALRRHHAGDTPDPEVCDAKWQNLNPGRRHVEDDDCHTDRGVLRECQLVIAEVAGWLALGAGVLEEVMLTPDEDLQRADEALPAFLAHENIA